ncbi:hypothetical protein HYX13_03010 [Candidatus Woesearchaeota archaeon]|nr:hypothetical protein [Candidatus Woesearchaeota archaeon]
MATDIQKELGTIFEQVFREVFGKLQGYQRVQQLLKEGNVDQGLKELRGITRSHQSALQDAVERIFPGQPFKGLQEALSDGDYDTVVRRIGEAKLGYDEMQRNVFNGNTLLVAEHLCGSILRYVPTQGKERLAVLSRVSAWTHVGGKDQSIPEATPGTVGVWQSKKYGKNVEVGIIAAHAPRKSGIVAIWGVHPLVDGEIKAEVTGKTEISDFYGFNDSRVAERNLSEERMPLEISGIHRKKVRLAGGESFLVAAGEKVNHSSFLGSYNLVRA